MNTDLSTLRDLAARLERATGPDLEIDGIIEDLWPNCRVYGSAYSGSLDAVAALQERLLPGWLLCVTQCDNGTTWLCEMALANSRSIKCYVYGEAPTECLARLCAVVAALIAQKETEE